MPHKVLIIRPEEQALETQKQLAAMGIDSDILSLMSYVYYNKREQIISTLKQTGGVICTSSHGLYPFKTLPSSLFTNRLCLVPGQSTAGKAKDYGFQNIVISPGGTASGIIDLIKHKEWQDRQWLYSRGQVISFDMKSALGSALHEIITYDLEPLPPSPSFIDSLHHAHYDATLCFSQKMASHFLNLIQEYHLSSFLIRTPIFCLSAQIAALFPGTTTTFFPSLPETEALLQQLKNFLTSKHK